ncbi:hypothetical protein UYO_3124 [Lachnospiraceae bacterium JC7]|nr:hypothetical protein UYO_3124 [Lachnospiraceae bacterium JC7]
MALDVDELHNDNVLSKSGTNLMHQAMFSEKECLIEHKFSSEYHLRAELNWYYQTISEGKKYIRMNIPICRYSLGGISERSSSAQLNFEETKHIINSYGYDASEYEKRVFSASVSRDIYKNIYNNWLSLRQSGITMRDYLYSKNISRVAVFGYGELGCHVINELKDTDIKIICIIESSYKYQYSSIPILTPDKIGDMNDVDIIIVASIIRSKEIIDMYQKRTPYKMVPLENILEDMWNESTA